MTAKTSAGRKPGPVDFLGRPEPWVVVYSSHGSQAEDHGPRIDRYSTPEMLLRLMAAWARNQCTPPGLSIHRRTVGGWECVS